MAGGKISSNSWRMTRWKSGTTGALRVADTGNLPLAVAFFQRVFHHHAAIHNRIILLMKGNGGECFLLFKSDGGGGHFQRFQIEPRMGLEAI